MKTFNNIIMVAVLLLGLSGLSMGQQKTTKHEYVDLGLPSGTLWATCNVGAIIPEDYGNYYAWGEIQSKPIYKWITYKYSNGKRELQLTKYSHGIYYKYNSNTDNLAIDEFTDNLNTLHSCDDAATINWGDEWCMPTKNQWEELEQNSTSTWTTLNGVNGLLFSSNNGNSLFLPAAGGCVGELDSVKAGIRGNYWSSSLSSRESIYAYYYGFESNQKGIENDNRYYGFSVRPVHSNKTINKPNQKKQSTKSSQKNTKAPTTSKKETTITNELENQGEIFMIVEDMPLFPGGDNKLEEYLSKEMQYPYEARTNCIQGTVTVFFVIEPDGSISNIKVKKSVGSGCDEEAVRLINTMPKWRPGMNRGKPVRVQKTMDIHFEL